GAMRSSIDEMARFVQFMLNRGQVGESQVITDSLFDRLARPLSSLAAQSGIEYGYSFGVGPAHRNGAIWFGHGGAVPGFLSDYRYNPDADIGYVLLQNQFGIILYSDLYDTIQAALAPLVDSVEPPPAAALTTEQLETYCGYYLPRSPRLQISAFGELLAGGLTVLTENDTLYTQGFMEDKDPLIPVSGNLFRRPGHPQASRVFATTPDGRMVYASQGFYYERTAFWKTLIHRILVFGAVILMLSSMAYALVWVPVHLYKRFTHNENRSKYLSMRVVPLLAVLSLILGIMPLSDSTLIEFGSFTLSTAIFFVSTLLFAGFSTLSVYTSYRSFFKPVKTVARVYAVLLSTACFGMTLYLGYWDVIGLRLWAY
ncbi:MAG: serine hydrolase, partial [Candidatus Zixiibacteriota bacterium]